MLYDIRLTMTYHSRRPIGVARHLLRLMPATLPGIQTVRLAEVTTTPAPASRSEFTDFFCNRVVEVSMAPGHRDITFALKAVVERLSPPRTADLSPPLSALPQELAEVRDLSPESPHHFLAASPRIRPDAAITALAAQATAKSLSLRLAVEAYGLALHTAMSFDSDATTVDTPPAEAFAQRRGVCQDFAQIMIAGLRGIGVPAAYVSGFLRTLPPPGKPRLEGADAMHAWTRVWCGTTTGWLDYDPTNACFAGADHITVGYGRDYGDLPPVAGVMRIAGGQSSTQAVDVVALPETVALRPA